MDDSFLMAQFENPRSHRLDAAKIARAFGVPLETFAKMLQTDEHALRRCTDSKTLQATLHEAVDAYSYLSMLFPLDETISKWMYQPLPSLDGTTPVKLAQVHGIVALRELAGAMAAGNYL